MIYICLYIWLGSLWKYELLKIIEEFDIEPNIQLFELNLFATYPIQTVERYRIRTTNIEGDNESLVSRINGEKWQICIAFILCRTSKCLIMASIDCVCGLSQHITTNKSGCTLYCSWSRLHKHMNFIRNYRDLLCYTSFINFTTSFYYTT